MYFHCAAWNWSDRHRIPLSEASVSPVKNGDNPALFPALSEESPERGDAQLVLSLSELIRPWAKHWWGFGVFVCIVAFHPCNNPMRTLLFISSFSKSLNIYLMRKLRLGGAGWGVVQLVYAGKRAWRGRSRSIAYAVILGQGPRKATPGQRAEQKFCCDACGQWTVLRT